MKKLFAIAILASFTAFAAPLKWTCDWPEAKSQNFSLYQGETATFEPTFRVNGQLVTNATIDAVWYQTNGMDNAWWRVDNATFAPSNDVGAATYRFFVEATALGGTVYRANGSLRMLPSPGFTPNVISFPAQALDFTHIDVANAPYYTKGETDAKIVELAPAPGNYAAVSNAAMTALQSFTETDPVWESEKEGYAMLSDLEDYATMSDLGELDDRFEALETATNDLATAIGSALVDAKDYTDTSIGYVQDSLTPLTFNIYSDIRSASKAATNYTDSATNGLLRTETDPSVHSWAKAASKPSYSFSEIGNKPTTLAGYGITDEVVAAADLPVEVYRLVAGTNVVDVITNYDSVVHTPARYLQQLDTNNVWHTIWDERTRHAETLASAVAAVTSATNALAAAKADRAWSKYTSAYGYDAPEGTTWISTPTTVIAGGYDYQRTITSSGQYWFLTSNGMAANFQQGATNAYLDISAADGTPIFRIEKTDAVLVGVDASGISMSGSTATVSVPIVAGSHPFARVCTNLVNATWYKEDENGMPAGSPASVSWSGSSGAYVATVNFGSSRQGFCFFEYLQEGSTKIINNGVTDLSGGIIYNGVKYTPRVNNYKLEFVAEGH